MDEANPSNIARVSTESSSGNDDSDNCAKAALEEENHKHAKQGGTDTENSRRGASTAAAAAAAAHPPNPPHSTTTSQPLGSNNKAKDNAVELVHLFMGALLKSNNAGGDGTLVAKTNPVETRKRIQRKRQINRESAKRKRVRAKKELVVLAKRCEELQASNFVIKNDNSRLLQTIRVETETRNQVLLQLQQQLAGRGSTAVGATSSQPSALPQPPTISLPSPLPTQMTTQAPPSQQQPSSQLPGMMTNDGNLANQGQQVEQLKGQHQQIASIINFLSGQQQQQQQPQQSQKGMQDMLRSLQSLLFGSGISHIAPVASNPPQPQQLPFAAPPAPLPQIMNPSTNNASPPNNQIEELQKLLLVLVLAAYFSNMQQQQQNP